MRRSGRRSEGQSLIRDERVEVEVGLMRLLSEDVRTSSSACSGSRSERMEAREVMGKSAQRGIESVGGRPRPAKLERRTLMVDAILLISCLW